MMHPEYVKAAAVTHTAGFSAQSAASRFFSGRFRTGGARIFSPSNGGRDLRSVFGNTMTERERAYRDLGRSGGPHLGGQAH